MHFDSFFIDHSSSYRVFLLNLQYIYINKHEFQIGKY